MSSALRACRPRTVLRTATTALGALVLAATTATVVPAATAAAPTTSASSTSRAAAPTAVPSAARADTPLPVTPGDFTGYGFDQCLTPTQATMNTWLQRSPFLAVGIYISGDSRACRSQPNLTPTWVRNQLLKGWRLLPITLGPQASCQPRFPRYSDDFKISPDPGPRNRYPKARAMARDSAASTVVDAQRLGIPAGSTLWYDLEGFDHTNTHCRESALAFVSTWVINVRRLGYVTGVYSSAGSGIKVLDDARVNRPGAFALPDQIWVARWDGVANTSTSYLRGDGWVPGGRVKQYRGGHDEVWGGVRINIDSNFLDVGRGSVAPGETHCGGVTVSFRRYGTLRAPSGTRTPAPGKVRALQCLLSEHGYYRGAVDGRYSPAVLDSVRRWKADRAQPASDHWFPRDWMTLLSWGNAPILKIGSASGYVRRVQRALNSANIGTKLAVSGTFDGATAEAVKTYQRRVGITASGIADTPTWTRLRAGVR
ncbi:glycoside hydrolase domain-containing protein [Nocardioides dongxiaopingii]|uniref:glycoside hydrolase domain-containing protein n=1 Tax=Nocardioides dongxiaopingii TaxID=2576036 RepID=UPI0010C769DF|nr:glycoside hydrolase domain-containing protein [Nocardioides dongxiaopingii]